MVELVTLTEDGPFGPAGTQVWVNDPSDVEQKTSDPVKKPAKKTQPAAEKSI